MSSVLFAALVFFVISASVTPGPNNIMLMASGANFGLRRTLPHMMGVVVGFPLMLVMVGAGLSVVLQDHPVIHQIIRYAGAAYMLWMAWKIAMARPEKKEARQDRPMRFLEAVFFQWINPKAWTFAISAIAAYTTPGGSFALQLGIIVLVCTAVCIPNSLLWITGGKFLSRLLNDPARMTLFNRIMGGLLALSIIPILFY